MPDSSEWQCSTCGERTFEDGDDGFYYCLMCGSQVEGFIETGVAEEDFMQGDTRDALYIHHRAPSRVAPVKAEPLSQFTPSTYRTPLDVPEQPQKIEPIDCEDELFNGIGPTGPSDFGSDSDPKFEDYYNQVRLRYVMGLQLMIEWQCEALVEKFGAHASICGLAATFWLRYVALSGVFADEWPDIAIKESEMKISGDPPENIKHGAYYRNEPRNLFGQRVVIIWHDSLRKQIPLSTTLAVCFLACHVAREPILPTDILKWSLEGKLPYFAAFLEIEKHLGPPTRACQLSSRSMFRPVEAVPMQKLESLAASIAQKIGLNLPPVNFYSIASRYLNQLSLPLDRILQYACRIYEWSMPSELYLSASEFRLPTRVCVLSILIVAIRILYNLHGFGVWEKSLLRPKQSKSSFRESELDFACSSWERLSPARGFDSPSFDMGGSVRQHPKSSLHVQNTEMDAAELLQILEANINKIGEIYEYSKDLPTYLKYCKDVVFAAPESLYEHSELEKVIEHLWAFYIEEKEHSESNGSGSADTLIHKRSMGVSGCANGGVQKENRKHGDESMSLSVDDEISGSAHHRQQSTDREVSPSSLEVKNSHPHCQSSMEKLKDEAIRRLKLDMEENRFCYIPPRVSLKRFDYLHYARKRDEGAFTYIAHADYYIVLRACARAAQVDIRIMHIGVLSFEKRLAWIEKRIDHCLQMTPLNFSCEFCSDQETDMQ